MADLICGNFNIRLRLKRREVGRTGILGGSLRHVFRSQEGRVRSFFRRRPGVEVLFGDRGRICLFADIFHGRGPSSLYSGGGWRKDGGGSRGLEAPNCEGLCSSQKYFSFFY